MTDRTLEQILSLLDLDAGFLRTLEQEGIVVRDASGRYQAATVERIRLCQTLHDDLGVNVAGIEVALNLLNIIDAERRQFADVLKQMRKRYASL